MKQTLTCGILLAGVCRKRTRQPSFVHSGMVLKSSTYIIYIYFVTEVRWPLKRFIHIHLPGNSHTCQNKCSALHPRTLQLGPSFWSQLAAFSVKCLQSPRLWVRSGIPYWASPRSLCPRKIHYQFEFGLVDFVALSSILNACSRHTLS